MSTERNFEDELAVCKAFHKVAIRERDHERMLALKAEAELTAYQTALENACALVGIPFERDQPEKTLAKVVEAAIAKAIEEHISSNDHLGEDQ